MNFQFYLEKLQASEVFKNFMKEHEDAFLCSGFFVIDFDKKDAKNQYHMDYYIPSDKKFFSFQLENDIQMIPIDILNKEEVFEEIKDCDFDFEEIKNLIVNEKDKRGIKNNIQKILLSLQTKKGECFIIATVFISTLGMLKVTIDLEKKEIIDFDRKSFMDMIKVFGKKNKEQ